LRLPIETRGVLLPSASRQSEAMSDLQSGESFANAPGQSRRRYFITDLGTLGGSESFAYGINDHGEVFGLSFLAGDTAASAFSLHSWKDD
jgi:uncharacterized membrane protein